MLFFSEPENKITIGLRNDLVGSVSENLKNKNKTKKWVIKHFFFFGGEP